MLPIVSPSVVTKQLAFNRVGDKRKVRFRPTFGCYGVQAVWASPLSGGGDGRFSVIPATDELQTHQFISAGINQRVAPTTRWKPLLSFLDKGS